MIAAATGGSQVAILGRLRHAMQSESCGAHVRTVGDGMAGRR
jgi:hypothetical protein